MKPLISYYGGKQRIASKIIKYLPKHTVYVEPFCGGAAVFFAKPWPDVNNGDHYREVLNDIDGNLINFYRVMQDDGKELIKQLQLTPYSRSDFELAVKIQKGKIPANALKKAWSYFVGVTMSFSNIPCAGWGVGLYGRNLGQTWLNKVSRLNDVLERLSGVHIEHMDALDVIKRWDSSQTLFYCDPPYLGTMHSYAGKYTLEYHRALINALETCKASFVLSGYPNEYVPEHWPQIKFNVTMTASFKKENINKKRTECIWVVDRSENVRPEIKKLFDSGKYNCFPGIKQALTRRIRNPQVFVPRIRNVIS